MAKITSIEMLEAVYDRPVNERSLWKEIDHINRHYRRFIEASPFLLLATHGDKAYFQCQKAPVRSRLRDPAVYPGREDLPSAGQMTKHFAKRDGQDFDAESYDQNYPEYMKETIY